MNLQAGDFGTETVNLNTTDRQVQTGSITNTSTAPTRTGTDAASLNNNFYASPSRSVGTRARVSGDPPSGSGGRILTLPAVFQTVRNNQTSSQNATVNENFYTSNHILIAKRTCHIAISMGPLRRTNNRVLLAAQVRRNNAWFEYSAFFSNQDFQYHTFSIVLEAGERLCFQSHEAYSSGTTRIRSMSYGLNANALRYQRAQSSATLVPRTVTVPKPNVSRYKKPASVGYKKAKEVCIPTTAVLTEMAGIENFFGRAADAYNVRFLHDLDLTARVQNYPLAARTQSVILIPKQKVSGKLKPACPFHALYNAILTIRPQNENYHGARVSLVATHYVMIGGVERSFETETPRIFNFSAEGGSYQGIANTINLGVFNSINEINIGDDIPGTNGQMQFTAESFEREIDFSLSLKITPARVAGGGSLVDGSFNIEVDGEAFFFQFAPVVTFNPRTSILNPHEHGSVVEHFDYASVNCRSQWTELPGVRQRDWHFCHLVHPYRDGGLYPWSPLQNCRPYT